jgi:hypothetical protein
VGIVEVGTERRGEVVSVASCRSWGDGGKQR